jgi:predicted flap endonuclease-1-like 5' DNA nuclease
LLAVVDDGDLRAFDRVVELRGGRLRDRWIGG